MTEQHTRIPVRGRGGTLLVVHTDPRHVMMSLEMSLCEAMTLGSELDKGRVKVRMLGNGVVEIEHPEGSHVEIMDTKSWR